MQKVPSLTTYLEEASALIRRAAAGGLDERMEQAISVIVGALSVRKPLLICGNGGSAADSQHIAGELVGRFLKERVALKVVSLAANPAVLTAWSNDYSFDTVFSRQVEGLGDAGGVLIGLSTSGDSTNVIRALETARSMGMVTIGMTGRGGGRMASLCDVLLDVPSMATPRIQEVHVCLYHYLCQEVERRIAG